MNRPRLAERTDHVESWFVRANDPASPRAIWLRATVLTRVDGSTLSQAWFSIFDGDRTQALCHDEPLATARFDWGSDGPAGLTAEVGPLALALTDGGGTSRGELGPVAWDLGFRRVPGPLGAPLSLLPSARLVDAPFPRNKLLTPVPAAVFSGGLTWAGEPWDLTGWVGMQGHNWGAAHAPEYAWGQCVFTDADANPVGVLEGASGRIEIGGRTSPLLSMLVIRHAGVEHRFDRLLDLWRQHPELDFPRWRLGMSGRAGSAELEVVGSPDRTVCLDYQNPARATSYCLNSKTARVRVKVQPRRGRSFELSSAHGGALEFLGPAPVAGVSTQEQV